MPPRYHRDIGALAEQLLARGISAALISFGFRREWRVVAARFCPVFGCLC